MGDGSLRPLQLVDADEDARRFDAVVQAMAGGPAQLRAPQPVFAIVAEVARLAVLVERLGERLEALEAELVPRAEAANVRPAVDCPWSWWRRGRIRSLTTRESSSTTSAAAAATTHLDCTTPGIFSGESPYFRENSAGCSVHDKARVPWWPYRGHNLPSALRQRWCRQAANAGAPRYW